jgi:gas vesicle protein
MTTAIDTAMGTAKEALGSAKHAAKDVAEDTVDAVRDTADDAAKRVKKIVSFLRSVDSDDMLGLVGLSRKPSAMSTIALIGGGVILGAGITLLLTPVSGKKVRAQIMKFFEGIGESAKSEVDEVKEKAGKIAGEVKDKASEVVSEAKDKASEVAGEAKDKASEVAGEVKDKVEKAQAKVGEVVGQAVDSDEAGDERKGRRRNNQSAQIS